MIDAIAAESAARIIEEIKNAEALRKKTSELAKDAHEQEEGRKDQVHEQEETRKDDAHKREERRKEVVHEVEKRSH